MAKKNKPLNVGGFMQEVKNNQPTKNEEFPEKNKEVTVPESTQSSVVDDGGRKLDPVVQPVEEMSAQETKPESKKVSRDSQADVAKERKSTQIKKQLGGRPTKVTQRNIKQVFKVDAQSSTDSMMIKAINRIDVQDVVFTAVQEFLAKYYTRGLGLSNDAIERITEITEKYDV